MWDQNEQNGSGKGCAFPTSNEELIAYLILELAIEKEVFLAFKHA